MIVDSVVREARQIVRASFVQQAGHIQATARRGETRVVRLGPILLFCAQHDAWMLDPTDRLARCLMNQDERLPLGIVDQGARFGVKWHANYHIAGDDFLFRQFGSSTVYAVEGYPVREILEVTSDAGLN